MSYLKDPSGFVMIRTSKSHWYEAGSGQQQPKLYARGTAINLCKRKNERDGAHPSDGHWEVVPVTLTFGEPLDLDVKEKSK